MGNYNDLKKKAKAEYSQREQQTFKDLAPASTDKPITDPEVLKANADRLAYEKQRDIHIAASKTPGGYLPRQDPDQYSPQANRESRNQKHLNYEDWQPGDGGGKKYDPKYVKETDLAPQFNSKTGYNQKSGFDHVNQTRAQLGLKPLDVANPNNQELASKTKIDAPKPGLAPVDTNSNPDMTPKDNFAGSSIRRIAALSEENRKRTQ